jgi:iron complex outermembrane receptor protein
MSSASAQSSPGASNSTLPPVTIESPQQRQAKPLQTPQSVASRGRGGSRRTRNPAARAAPTVAAAPARETAYGHVDGYVATRSATGTKTDTPLIETPQSISVVTRDQIEAQGAQSIKQALGYTAGVASESRSNFGGYDIMYGRGFILDQYLDGMKLQGATAQFTPQPELYGLERIEVLRGPASMLFGQASPGGLVNMVSKRPSDIPFNEAFIQGGSYDRIQGGFDSTGKIDKDGQFLYRITGFAKDADNQVDFVREQRLYIAPSLTWRPDKDTSWTVMLNYQKDPSVGYYNFVPFNGSLGFNPNGKIPTNFYAGDPNFNTDERTQYSITSLFEHRFNDVFMFRQNMRYMDTTGELKQVFPLALYSTGNPAATNQDYGTLSRYAQGINERISAFSSDTQGEFDFQTGVVDHKVLVGVDNQSKLYTQANARSAQSFGSALSAPDLTVFNPTYGYQILNPLDDPSAAFQDRTHQTLQQNGVYAQDQMKLGRLTVVGGLRYDIAQSTTGTSQLGTFELGSLSTVRQDDHATTGRIGAIYEFDSGVAPYVTYATSFDPTAGVDANNQPLRPTTGELYEGGIKFQPKGSKIFVQASVFDLTEQNVLSFDAISQTSSQIGEVRSQGFEIEGNASLTDRLDLIASYTHVDPKVTRSTDIDLGKVPTWVPRDIGAIWADYTFHDGALNGFGIGAGVRYTGQTWGDTGNTLLDVPAYTLVDAALHYDLVNLDPRLKGMRLSVNATNLFDKIYVSQCTVQLLDNACVYGLRRQVLASLRYRW